MSLVAHSSSPILNPDRNPVLHFLLKKTFYAHFCAGETPSEVQATAQRLRTMGFKGVILAYGKEIVLNKASKAKILSKAPNHDPHQTPSSTQSSEDQALAAQDIEAWRKGTLATVDMTHANDFVALKFSGAGPATIRQLAYSLPPTPALEAALVEICNRAREQNVALLFDAEQSAIQPGIDAWTLEYQRRYNQERAVVYGTYQAYLKSTPNVLSAHLEAAKQGNFNLGVKLVRGAYMASDPREIFWDSKEATDKAYDGITQALVSRTWTSPLSPSEKGSDAFPAVTLVLASHNRDSVTKCMHTRRQRILEGQRNVQMAYAQLMGMADEVSCELVLAAKRADLVERDASVGSNTFKYLVWGSVGECLKYLVRRAEENRGAVERAGGSRRALTGEVVRRFWG